MLGPLNTAFTLSFTMLMGEAAMLSSLLDPTGEVIHVLGKFWGTNMCRGTGVDLSVVGGDDVQWDKPLIVMANHQSYFDIPVLWGALPRSFGMLAKQELFKIPILRGTMVAMNCIGIDRTNNKSSLSSLHAAAEQVRGGKPIVVFPEGTRSPDGRIHPLKKGPFYLVQEANVPVVPVGIRGTRNVLAKDAVLVRGAPVSVHIGSPIAPTGVGQRGRDHMRTAVHRALVELSGLPAAS